VFFFHSLIVPLRVHKLYKKISREERERAVLIVIYHSTFTSRFRVCGCGWVGEAVGARFIPHQTANMSTVAYPNTHTQIHPSFLESNNLLIETNPPPPVIDGPVSYIMNL